MRHPRRHHGPFNNGLGMTHPCDHTDQPCSCQPMNIQSKKALQMNYRGALLFYRGGSYYWVVYLELLCFELPLKARVLFLLSNLC